MNGKQVFGYVIGVIVLFLGLSWVFTGNDFFLYKVFAPKQEQVRREVFEQSKAYNQGMVQELRSIQLRYVEADQAHKGALASMILHSYADYDENKLPPDLYSFIQEVKRSRGLGR